MYHTVQNIEKITITRFIAFIEDNFYYCLKMVFGLEKLFDGKQRSNLT